MLNKVTLIGRLGRDPENRYMPSGDAVCNFSLATSENYKDRSGAKQERTEWHNIVMFGRVAEVASQYLRKGSQVYLEGKIQSRKYTDKNGVERTSYEIVCNEMKMLDTKNSNSNSMPNNTDYPEYYSAGSQSSNYSNSNSNGSNGSGSDPYYSQSAEVPEAPQARPQIAQPKPVENIEDDIPF